MDSNITLPEPTTFTFTREGQDAPQEIVLQRLLVGVNTVPKTQGKRSQADVFASYALQCGFTSEDEILAKYPRVAENLKTSFTLIDIWADEVDQRQQSKAYETMKANGNLITTRQRDLARSLMPQLVDAMFRPHAERIGAILSAYEDEDGPQGAELKKAIDRAFQLLGKPETTTQSTQRPTNASQATAQVAASTDPGVEVGTKAVAVENGSGEDPF